MIIHLKSKIPTDVKVIYQDKQTIVPLELLISMRYMSVILKAHIKSLKSIYKDFTI